MSKQADNYQTTQQSQAPHQQETKLPLKSKSKNKRKHQSHGRFDNYQQALWKQSPNSLTRDQAPSHRIPKAERFRQNKADGLKLNNFLTIQHYPTENDSMNKTGVSFCRSTRPQHFIKQDSIKPSPASYRLQRFLDTTQYKAKTQISQTLSPNKKNSQIKGGVIKQFQKYHKSYVPHSKHRNYQPQNTIDNPAPNHYSNKWSKRKQIKYTFRAKLKNHNQTFSNFPGPTAYRLQQQQKPSFNVKGTFQLSTRTYLKKIQEGPASNQYNIPRFLQKQTQ